jgi:hypothetical protein
MQPESMPPDLLGVTMDVSALQIPEFTMDTVLAHHQGTGKISHNMIAIQFRSTDTVHYSEATHS